ncbi:MAG TPA: YgiT-type zinc finger protein [Alphaproteobacteria bacterium]|nr:YgiT-type zinc finger protein [Alphaproteobacteria bacterium]
MKCAVCGAQLQPVHSDLPFKVSEQTIVIIKQPPVWQCPNCAEYLIEDRVLRRVDEILAGVDYAAELEIIRFAA